MAKKKQRPRPNQKAKEAARAKARNAREREFMAGTPINLDEARLKSEALMAEMFGPPPEGGYAHWQRYARDLVEEGVDRAAAATYAQQYYAHFETVRLDLFPNIPADKLDDEAYGQVEAEVEKILPNPFSLSAP